MAKIEIKNVYKDYENNDGTILHAVKNATLTVNDGEVVVIIGPSGSGKSTLLRTVNALEKAQSGSILIDGVDIMDPKTDIRKIREEVGMVFQSFNLFPHLTVLENIVLAPMKVKKMSRKEAEALGMKLLKRVGLEERQNKSQASFQEASSNESPSQGHWQCSQRQCSSTSLLPPWTRK